MNIVVGDYVINIKNQTVLNQLKPLDYYNNIPDLFLMAYTDLDSEDIEEILKDDELKNTMIKEVYKNLNISDETTFIRTVNKTFELVNSIEGVLIVALNMYYQHSLSELIKLSSSELLAMFIIELKINGSNKKIEADLLKTTLLNYYSEETVNDFINQCYQVSEEEMQKNWEKDFNELNNL